MVGEPASARLGQFQLISKHRLHEVAPNPSGPQCPRDSIGGPEHRIGRAGPMLEHQWRLGLSNLPDRSPVIPIVHAALQCEMTDLLRLESLHDGRQALMTSRELGNAMTSLDHHDINLDWGPPQTPRESDHDGASIRCGSARAHRTKRAPRPSVGGPADALRRSTHSSPGTAGRARTRRRTRRLDEIAAGSLVTLQQRANRIVDGTIGLRECVSVDPQGHHRVCVAEAIGDDLYVVPAAIATDADQWRRS